MATKKLEKRLREISDDPALSAGVYHEETKCVFFIVKDGEILEMTDDNSDSPKGGSFPRIVSGYPEEENRELQSVLEQYGVEEEWFDAELTEEYEDLDEEDEERLEELFEDEDAREAVTRLIADINGGKLPYADLGELVERLRRTELEEGRLYYEWYDDYIDLWENIADVGESRGTYEDLSDEEWLEILEDLPSCRVEPDD